MYIEKIYILSIIFVITITFINEIAPLDILMDIRTILLIALVGRSRYAETAGKSPLF
jgi:hypothetical protein